MFTHHPAIRRAADGGEGGASEGGRERGRGVLGVAGQDMS